MERGEAARRDRAARQGCLSCLAASGRGNGRARLLGNGAVKIGDSGHGVVNIGAAPAAVLRKGAAWSAERRRLSWVQVLSVILLFKPLQQLV